MGFEGTTHFFLWVGLFAAASNFNPGESGGGAAALVLEVSDDASVNNSASNVE